MTIEAQCTACGEDCTRANATYHGDIYHVGCLPIPKWRDENREASNAHFDSLISRFTRQP